MKLKTDDTHTLRQNKTNKTENNVIKHFRAGVSISLLSEWK